MIRLRPHRVGKAESLFVANLKPFFDSIGRKTTCTSMASSSSSSIMRATFKGTSKGRHSVARAFLRGALDNIMRPVKGRPSSKIRNIAEAAEKANSERQVKSVMFRGEKRL